MTPSDTFGISSGMARSVKVTDETYAVLKQTAEDEDRAIASVIRRALDTYLSLPFRDSKTKREKVT